MGVRSEVTGVFDDMLERSVPQYDVMWPAVFDTRSRLVRLDTAAADLGCRRGIPARSLFLAPDELLGVRGHPGSFLTR